MRAAVEDEVAAIGGLFARGDLADRAGKMRRQGGCRGESFDRERSRRTS